MRNFKTEGIIIRRRNFRDADRILTVLTANNGKIAVRASGIRKIPSRRSPHVELLNHSMLTLYNGHAFPVLTEAQTIDSFSGVKEDFLAKDWLAYHLCELVDGLCPEGQENRAVFELLKKTLQQLAFQKTQNTQTVSESDIQIVRKSDVSDSQSFPSILEIVDSFQTELLSLLGYWDKKKFLVKEVDMDSFVENILERKLKSKSIFAKLQ